MGQFLEPPVTGFANPMTQPGDIIAGGVAGAPSRVPGNPSTVTLVLTQSGDGVTPGTPSWQPVPVAGSQSYIFANIASDIATYYQMPSLDSYVAGALATVTKNLTVGGVLMAVFATNTGYPNATVIPAGVFSCHYETQKAAGANNYYTYYEVWKRTAGGAETKLLTSDNSSQSALNTVIQNTVSATLTTDITLLSTDRLLIKIYGVMLASTANVDLLFDDTTNSRITIPGVTVDSTNFVPYTGATKNVDLGAKTLAAANVTNVNTLILNTTGGTTVLTAVQGRNTSFEVTGALVSNAIIVVPDFMAPFTAENLTTGAFTVTFKTAAGAGVAVPQTTPPTITLLYADGVDCEQLTQNVSGVITSTWAGLPAPGSVAAYTQQYMVTDFPGGAQVVYSDGAKWKTLNRAYTTSPIIEAVPATTTSTTEVIIKNYLLPAGFLKVGDVVRWGLAFSKNNNTNVQNLQIHIGTAGTVADTGIVINSAVTIAAATQNGAYHGAFVVMSATTIACLEPSNMTTVTRLATIPDISNALYLDFGVNNVTSTATVFTEEGYFLDVIK